jgi:glutamine amidotransferase
MPDDEKFISSKTNYSEEIVASVEKDNLFGTQFHPEKSDTVGLKIIENFIKL